MVSPAPVIGVVALQGAVTEHMRTLTVLGAEVRRVTRPEHLAGLTGLVLPGGESTAMVRLAAGTGLFPALTDAARAGLPVLGTCAGLILLAREVEDGVALEGFARVPVLDLTARRNAYGAQRESFTARVALRTRSAPGTDPDDGPDALDREIDAVFIRAPQVTRVGPGVEVLAAHAGRPVLVRQGAVMAAAFHPELTADPAVHRLFLTAAAAQPVH
ncbi:pyridoxal 5'-phosphate synthase pdxT subunit [Brevibacterium pityocampae]